MIENKYKEIVLDFLHENIEINTVFLVDACFKQSKIICDNKEKLLEIMNETPEIDPDKWIASAESFQKIYSKHSEEK